MDIEIISTLIGTYGFPIFICIFFIKFLQDYVKKQQEKDEEMVEKFFNYIKEEQSNMKDAINKLEIAIVKLTEQIENKEDKKDDI